MYGISDFLLIVMSFKNLNSLWDHQFSTIGIFPMDLEGHMLTHLLFFLKLKHIFFPNIMEELETCAMKGL